MMKKILLPLIITFSLVSGMITGIAYERYANREECLKMTFSETPSDLSPEEIENITKALNSEERYEGNTAATENNPSALEDSSTPSDRVVRAGSPQLRGGKFVGSKNSNKFYPVDCRYAKLIKEENKVFFETVEEGEKAGRNYVECK